MTSISNVIESPSAGVESPDVRVFAVTRSASLSTTTDSSKSSPTMLGSSWSGVLAADVVLVIVLPPSPTSTVPVNVKVATALLLSVPIVHRPVAGS